MNGTITFPVSGGIAKFFLESINNIHTDGSGVLKFNVVTSAAAFEFNFTCSDEAAAQRIANLIAAYKGAGYSGSFVVGDNVNYPLPPIPSVTARYLYYDPLNNNWFLLLRGTNMDSAATILFAGIMRGIASISSTELTTETFERPPYGDLDAIFVDSKGNNLGSATISFHYAITTFLPNPFVAGVDDFVVNGEDFDALTLGVVWVEDDIGNQDFNSGHCPATFFSASQLSCPAADWNPGDAATTPPLWMVYIDSGGNWSNFLYVATIT